MSVESRSETFTLGGNKTGRVFDEEGFRTGHAIFLRPAQYVEHEAPNSNTTTTTTTTTLTPPPPRQNARSFSASPPPPPHLRPLFLLWIYIYIYILYGCDRRAANCCAKSTPRSCSFRKGSNCRCVLRVETRMVVEDGVW